MALPIILGALVAGGAVVDAFRGANESMKIDERAKRKFARAYERQAEANALVKKKNEEADAALRKVINRKRGILASSMKDFLTLYEKIIKIDFLESQGMKELHGNIIAANGLKSMQGMVAVAMRPMTDMQLIGTFLGGGGGVGIGHAMIEDSKRNLSQANKQLRAADVVYSQAENLSSIIDIMIQRSNQMAGLLARLNLLFIKSIKHTNQIIDKNGFDRNNYTQDDRKALMTCMNTASAIKKIIDVPLIDRQGQLAKETMEAINIGNQFLNKLKMI